MPQRIEYISGMSQPDIREIAELTGGKHSVQENFSTEVTYPFGKLTFEDNPTRDSSLELYGHISPHSNKLSLSNRINLNRNSIAVWDEGEVSFYNRPLLVKGGIAVFTAAHLRRPQGQEQANAIIAIHTEPYGEASLQRWPGTPLFASIDASPRGRVTQYSLRPDMA